MKRIVSILCTICIIVVIVFANIPQKPKLVSSITSFEHAYLTILVDKREIRNLKNLEEKIIKMCREDTFDGMKLQTADRTPASNYHISVYTSRCNLEKGKVSFNIQYKEGE